MGGHKKLGYTLLRISLGLVLLVWGAEKFVMGRAVFAAAIGRQFAQSHIPAALVRLAGAAIPFTEVLLGALILLGAFTTIALTLAAIQMMCLTFGMQVAGQAGVVANNLIYTLAIFLLLFFSEHNAFAVERLWGRKAASQ